DERSPAGTRLRFEEAPDRQRGSRQGVLQRRGPVRYVSLGGRRPQRRREQVSADRITGAVHVSDGRREKSDGDRGDRSAVHRRPGAAGRVRGGDQAGRGPRAILAVGFGESAGHRSAGEAFRAAPEIYERRHARHVRVSGDTEMKWWLLAFVAAAGLWGQSSARGVDTAMLLERLGSSWPQHNGDYTGQRFS